MAKFKSIINTNLERIIANLSMYSPSSSHSTTISETNNEATSNNHQQETSGGTSQGLIVLAVVFSVFGLLVIIFMLYIVRRVRYRHLYMQVKNSFNKILSFSLYEASEILSLSSNTVYGVEDTIYSHLNMLQVG